MDLRRASITVACCMAWCACTSQTFVFADPYSSSVEPEVQHAMPILESRLVWPRSAADLASPWVWGRCDG